MPRKVLPLTDTKIKATKPAPDRDLKLSDGGGLYLLIKPNDTRIWRFKYRFGGNEKLISFGPYPNISLKDARQRREAARSQIARGVNPSQQRQDERQARSNTFRAIAEEWMVNFEKENAPSYTIKIRQALEKHIYNHLGDTPIAEIQPLALKERLDRLASTAKESARKLAGICERIYDHAISTGRCGRNVARDIKNTLPKVRNKNYPIITDPTELGRLISHIDHYEVGIQSVIIALRILPRVFTRNGELCKAQWSEINLEAKEWVIPAVRMKMRRDFIVPLSNQVVELFKEMEPITGRSKYVFEGRTRGKPISEGTLGKALRSLGYSGDRLVPHSFRGIASTILNEHGFDSRYVEKQLAHELKNQIEAKYNRAQYREHRLNMMQYWSDYLDSLKESGNVIPIRRAG